MFTLRNELNLSIFFLFTVMFICLPLSIQAEEKAVYELPEPDTSGKMSVETAINNRRSVRNYSKKSLEIKEISQILWAAQGITDRVRKFRAAPSAGALYPLEVYLVAGKVINLEPGVYKYIPESHNLKKIINGDLRNELSNVALGQRWIKEAPADIVITGAYEKTTGKYGERGARYVHMEAGHVSQNIYLQVTALKMETVSVGAFYDGKVRDLLNLSKKETPLYIMPVGNTGD